MTDRLDALRAIDWRADTGFRVVAHICGDDKFSIADELRRIACDVEAGQFRASVGGGDGSSHEWILERRDAGK